MINQTRIRTMLGWLALLLPWLVALIVCQFPQSISATYYTNASSTFMIILGACALLLMSYKGYDWKDDLITWVAGIFGLGICLFPMSYPSHWEKAVDIGRPFPISSAASNVMHSVCAAIFFLIIVYLCFFQFTKSNTPKEQWTKKKKIRNKIYIACGIGMLLGLLIFPLNALDIFVMKAGGIDISVWFSEMIALLFFALAWLTKSNRYWFLFADEPDSYPYIFIVAIIQALVKEEDDWDKG